MVRSQTTHCLVGQVGHHLNLVGPRFGQGVPVGAGTLRSPGTPPTGEEVRAAALQYVRKVSGYRKPSRANQQVFDQAVDEVAAITQKLLDNLTIRIKKEK